MALRIFNNMSSDFAQRSLDNNNRRLANTIKSVASGQRLNSSADDGASFALSEALRSNTRVLRQASRNANDSMSLINTAESSLNDISSVLIRMRELAQGASTGTITDSDRAAIGLEFQQSMREIDRLANTVEFNGQKLLNGALGKNAAGTYIQIGLNSRSENRVNLNQRMDIASMTTIGLGISRITIDTQTNALAAQAKLEEALNVVTSTRVRVGTVVEQMGHTISGLDVTAQNLVAAEEGLRDIDMGEGFAELTKGQILVQTSTAMVGQANLIPQSVLQLLRQ